MRQSSRARTAPTPTPGYYDLADIRRESRILAEETRCVKEIKEEITFAKLQRKKAEREKKESDERDRKEREYMERSEAGLIASRKVREEYAEAVHRLGKSVLGLMDANDNWAAAITKAESTVKETRSILASHGIVCSPAYRERRQLLARGLSGRETPPVRFAYKLEGPSPRSPGFFSQAVSRSESAVPVARKRSVTFG